MALKRVCDITGTDRDVEVCDVTIAGQPIKLDLAPAGAERLREFFGAVIVVRHPLDPAETGAAAGARQTAAEEIDAADEVAGIAEAGEETQEPGDSAEEPAEDVEPAPGPKPAARRGRRPAAAAKSVKAGRKKIAPRRAVKTDVPDTSEIREWARANGFEIGERGAIPGRIRSAYTLAHE